MNDLVAKRCISLSSVHYQVAFLLLLVLEFKSENLKKKKKEIKIRTPLERDVHTNDLHIFCSHLLTCDKPY